MTTQVRSVSLAFAILRAVAARPRGMTLSDVARAVDLSPSSTLNLLRTMVAEGAIERGEDDRRYRLVPGWSATGPGRSRIDRLIERARPVVRSFAEAHDCTVGLWQVTSPQRMSLVALWDSGAATRIHLVIGQRQPIGGGSIGRALAAFEKCGESELRRRYDSVRWQQPLAFSDYAAQVERARQGGYAVDDGLGHAGVCSVGAVIPGPGMPRLCLSVSIFAGSRDSRAIAELGRELVALANHPALAG